MGFALLTAYTGVVGASSTCWAVASRCPARTSSIPRAVAADAGLDHACVARWRRHPGRAVAGQRSRHHRPSRDDPGICPGFAFGWTIFQALFMRDMAGGSYGAALKGTFMSELLSMTC